ncbi:hypothetical protein ANMWB30_23580 [Arthrobacter sp. MWB30]|nr:hypothetical protein ANMWB30_23580 [Arthrobacter sp. MWB30]
MGDELVGDDGVTELTAVVPALSPHPVRHRMSPAVQTAQGQVFMSYCPLG